MTFLEHRVPPPIVGLLCGIAMWYLSRQIPGVTLQDSIRISLAILTCGIGLAIMLTGVISFRRAQTTINPLKPETATALVTSGVYRYTRNPMYLGMLLVLLGWSVFLASPAALTGVVAFGLYIQRFQILPEERALVAVFGSTFTDYMSRVRRWL
jgi:protein-S-isoprenylcysteine O-methyltransferase Ste14